MRRIFPDSLIGLVAGLLVAASFFFTVWTVDDSTTKTCQRQAQGAKAVPYLINTMDEFHQLLTLPPTKQSRQRQAELPPGEFKRETAILKALDTNLAEFVQIEHSLPKRTC